MRLSDSGLCRECIIIKALFRWSHTDAHSSHDKQREPEEHEEGSSSENDGREPQPLPQQVDSELAPSIRLGKNGAPLWLRKILSRSSTNKRGFVVLSTSLIKETENRASSVKPADPGQSFLNAAVTAYDVQNYELAIGYYIKAASHGEMIGLHNLGLMMLYGQGTPEDFGHAYECFLLCSTHGISASMAQIGYMYLHARGLPQSFARARKWFLQAHRVGNDSYAQFSLAVIYFRGLGVPVNKSAGKKWLVKSAINGYIPAIFNLAVMYENEGSAKAVDLYRFAALKKGHSLSQNNLAVLFADGSSSLKRDFYWAHTLFRMAAMQGSPDALYNLGDAYTKGIGVEQDIIRGAKYYYFASQHGTDGNAELKLGNLFWHGYEDRIQPSDSVALFWFGKAVQKGHKAARHNFFLIKQSLDSKNKLLGDLEKYQFHRRYVY